MRHEEAISTVNMALHIHHPVKQTQKYLFRNKQNTTYDVTTV